MTRIKLNPIFAGMSGKIGDIVIRTSKNGKTYISRCPRTSDAEPSEAQLAQREEFGKASTYAKLALADEVTRVFYETLAKASKKTARSVCMADYRHKPTVDDLDFSRYHGQVGDRIQISTYDDVGVVEVNVKLTTAEPDGTLIEYGKAVEQYPGSGYWEYVATVPVPLGTHIFISVEVFDRPGNRATASADPIVGQSH